MTQELVLVVLLAGLVGLVWIMTLSILADDRTTSKAGQTETPQPRRGDMADQEFPVERLLKGRTKVA